MRRYRIAIAPAVAETIRDLHPEIKKSVRNALEALRSDPKLGIPLRGELVGLWRYRVRRFRIVYDVVGSTRTVRIVAVGHRKTVYEDVADRRRDARPSEQRKPKRR